MSSSPAMKTGYFSHPDCRKHEMGRGHPECPERLDAINDHLLYVGLLDNLSQQTAPLADLEVIELAHSKRHIDSMNALNDALQQEIASDATGKKKYAQIDPDTAMNVHTWSAVRHATGAALAATDAVIAGELANAFCAIRPPGHHAEFDRAMGFCVINSVATAAKYALEHHGLSRVAIVDFDVHHGNGTQDIVSGDERILLFSSFQHPFYPHSGYDHNASNVVNMPLPAYTKGAVYRELVEANWLPRLEAFKPEMIFISAGFDAHKDDDLGQLGLVEADYAWITAKIKDIALRHCEGRIVSCLEGGYNLHALARSVEAHVRVLADL
jgi:acetoin utilization deacetylase AcuC-like enzyme